MYRYIISDQKLNNEINELSEIDDIKLDTKIVCNSHRYEEALLMARNMMKDLKTDKIFINTVDQQKDLIYSIDPDAEYEGLKYKGTIELTQEKEQISIKELDNTDISDWLDVSQSYNYLELESDISRSSVRRENEISAKESQIEDLKEKLLFNDYNVDLETFNKEWRNKELKLNKENSHTIDKIFDREDVKLISEERIKFLKDNYPLKISEDLLKKTKESQLFLDSKKIEGITLLGIPSPKRIKYNSDKKKHEAIIHKTWELRKEVSSQRTVLQKKIEQESDKLLYLTSKNDNLLKKSLDNLDILDKRMTNSTKKLEIPNNQFTKDGSKLFEYLSNVKLHKDLKLDHGKKKSLGM